MSIPKYTDCVQGGLADCYLIAALAEVSLKNPEIIQNMIIDNGDGTYTVRFYGGYLSRTNPSYSYPIYTTVDSQLPSGYASYAHGKWVALLEKAYVQMQECNWSIVDPNYGKVITPSPNSYASIAYGLVGGSMSGITSRINHSLFVNAPTTFNEIVNAYNANKCIGFGSGDNTTDGVIAGHAYAMVNLDITNQIFTLYNPWGFLTTLTWDQVKRNFLEVDYQFKKEKNMLPKYTDVAQGGLGDCGLMASCAEAAFRHPEIVQSMFIDNGDGTYTVRFYKDGVPWYTTIDSQLPSGYASGFNGLWVAFLERAYAQMNESGWLDAAYNGQNTYNAIAGTYIFDAMHQITGLPVTPFNSPTNQQYFVDGYNAGKMIGFASIGSGTTNGVVANHAYAVIGYDPTTQSVTLFNPWGIGIGNGGLITLTWAQVVANYGYFDRLSIRRNLTRS